MMKLSIPYRDSRRVPLRFRPIKAFGHFQKLVANKEDTEQVFHMTACLPGKAFQKLCHDFCASEAGQVLMQREPNLPAILDDHDRLLAMPKGSVAHAYVAFMRREGLSAAGLVEESLRAKRPRFDDQVQWFNDRLRDTHDLVHVLTGFGRDALGEQCALGFSGGQYRGVTDRFLAWAGGFELRRRVKVDAPVFAAIREAAHMGRSAQKLYAQDIVSLLAEPLKAARERMGIATPVHYARAHQAYRAQGIDPYNFAGGAALA
jgi:ubiquinone biosynthesis protein COQ4